MKKGSLYIFLILLIFAGCKKRKEKNIQPSKDFALISNDISIIIPLISNIALTDELLKKSIATGQDSLNTCASLTLISGDTLNVSNSSPLTFELDFSSGCIDNDAIFKKGAIRCTIYGFMSNSGANCSCSFDDFEIGGNKLSGNVSVTNTGNLNLLVTTSNLKLKVGKKYIYYDGEYRMLQLAGENTPENLLDNSYSVSSLSVLTDRYGKEFEVFAEELYKNYSCKWLTGGFAELNDDDNKVQVIDFGDRGCDNSANITIDEKSYTIDL